MQCLLHQIITNRLPRSSSYRIGFLPPQRDWTSVEWSAHGQSVYLTCHFGVVDSWIELFFFKDDHSRNDVPKGGHHVAVQMVGPKANPSNINLQGKRITLAHVVQACNSWHKDWKLSKSDCRNFGWHVRNQLGI